MALHDPVFARHEHRAAAHRPSSARPPARILNLVEAFTADCVCSAASLWELAIKARLHKLDLPCDQLALPDACSALGIAVIAVTPKHAVTPVDPWPNTNDPFDRILLSICAAEGLRLVTSDARLKDHWLAWRP